MNISEKINSYFDAEKYSKARTIILKELEIHPEDHWLLTRLSTAYYEERNYEKAVEFSRLAIRICPKCPLARWDYAGSLEMTGNPEEAIKIWRKLFLTDPRKMAKDPCGEGIAWSKALIMDSAYMLGIAYSTMGDGRNSKKYFNAHLKLRYPGNQSIYSMKSVKETMKELGMLGKCKQIY